MKEKLMAFGLSEKTAERAAGALQKYQQEYGAEWRDVLYSDFIASNYSLSDTLEESAALQTVRNNPAALEYVLGN